MDRYGASSRSYEFDDSDYSRRGGSTLTRTHGGRSGRDYSSRHYDSDDDSESSGSTLRGPYGSGGAAPRTCCCYNPALCAPSRVVPSMTGYSAGCPICVAEMGGRLRDSGRSRLRPRSDSDSSDDDEFGGSSSHARSMRTQQARRRLGSSLDDESDFEERRGSRRSHDSRSRAAPSAPSHRGGSSRITYEVEEPRGSSRPSHVGQGGQLLLPAPPSSSRSRTTTTASNSRTTTTGDRDDGSRRGILGLGRLSGRSSRH